MKPVFTCFLANGKAITDTSGFHPETNRSFQFGDGIFETMRMEQGRFLFTAFHFNRLTRSLKALGIETAGIPQPEELEHLIESRVNLPQARVKLLAFRDSLGAYVPEANNAVFYLQVAPLDKQLGLPSRGLTVGLYDKQRKVAGELTWMKSTSSQLYVMAGIHAQNQGWDDCLLINEKDELMEGSSSNLFAWLNGQWITPPVSSGCVEGVYRRALIESLQHKGIPFSEQNINKQDALNSDELILTNAVSGIRWIERFERKTFGCEMTRNLTEVMSAFSCSF